MAEEESTVAELLELNKKLVAENSKLKNDLRDLLDFCIKLDWSTVEPLPEVLQEYFDIQDSAQMSIPAADGTPWIYSGRQIDGNWHGPMKEVREDTKCVHSGCRVLGKRHGIW